MTDFWTETLTAWDRQAAERAAAEARNCEQQRQAIAKLLSVRGQKAAAAIVAMSGWQIDDVGNNWSGEHYRGVLAVPPEGFDAVTEDLRDAIAAAARAVVGEEFADLTIRVRLDEAELSWDEQLVAQLREQHTRDATATVKPVVLELPPGR